MTINDIMNKMAPCPSTRIDGTYSCAFNEHDCTFPGAKRASSGANRHKECEQNKSSNCCAYFVNWPSPNRKEDPSFTCIICGVWCASCINRPFTGNMDQSERMHIIDRKYAVLEKSYLQGMEQKYQEGMRISDQTRASKYREFLDSKDSLSIGELFAIIREFDKYHELESQLTCLYKDVKAPGLMIRPHGSFDRYVRTMKFTYMDAWRGIACYDCTHAAVTSYLKDIGSTEQINYRRETLRNGTRHDDIVLFMKHKRRGGSPGGTPTSFVRRRGVLYYYRKKV